MILSVSRPSNAEGLFCGIAGGAPVFGEPFDKPVFGESADVPVFGDKRDQVISIAHDCGLAGITSKAKGSPVLEPRRLSAMPVTVVRCQKDSETSDEAGFDFSSLPAKAIRKCRDVILKVYRFVCDWFFGRKVLSTEKRMLDGSVDVPVFENERGEDISFDFNYVPKSPVVCSPEIAWTVVGTIGTILSGMAVGPTAAMGTAGVTVGRIVYGLIKRIHEDYVSDTHQSIDQVIVSSESLERRIEKSVNLIRRVEGNLSHQRWLLMEIDLIQSGDLEGRFKKIENYLQKFNDKAREIRRDLSEINGIQESQAEDVKDVKEELGKARKRISNPPLGGLLARMCSSAR